MKVPSMDELEGAVFQRPPNPRAASILFGALLDVGIEPVLAGQAASALSRVYVEGLGFVRSVAADRGANALLYDEDFRKILKRHLVELETLSAVIPAHAAQLMDQLERRGSEPEDRARVRAWVEALRRIVARYQVESILDLPGETGVEGTPFGAGAVARVFKSLVIVGGLLEMLEEEELPSGVSAVALGEIMREIASRMRPAIVGDGRGWQGLVGYLNDFSAGGSIPPV
jgi:hypothetical protein